MAATFGYDASGGIADEQTSVAACVRAGWMWLVPSAEEPDTAAPLVAYDGATVTQASAQVDHGKRLSLVLGCTGCHGDDLRGAPFRNEPGFGSLHASNLTLRLGWKAGIPLRVATKSAKQISDGGGNEHPSRPTPQST
jgi:cytochrome c553